MENTSPKPSITFWIILAFAVWAATFFGFLSSKLVLFEDALSYYEHTKFFVENLAKGVYPLWDPFWFHGAPNDFFLRRIGSFNPFYLIIIGFEFLRIPYTYAYLWSLALYYWGGMIAFYLLSMRLYNNRLIAYTGYLILLFSSLGTRLFDSYMMLVTVPLIWFFYFLAAFSQTPRKQFFLGMCLAFMILSTTYIPFYFFSFLAVFIIFFVLFYFKEIPLLFKRYIAFFKNNKILVIISLGVILLSFVPSISFFHNSNHGQVVMPARHGEAASGDTFAVPFKTLDWGAVEDLLFSYYFSDFRTIRFAVVYIPFFAFIIFILGLFCRISRRAAFFFTCGFGFLCCIVPRGLPFYDFLYEHIFFLKYFRNLHFFLWFALIPLFILLVLEHWKIFDEARLTSRQRLRYVLAVHALLLLFIIVRDDAIPMTYVMLALSGLFWSLMALGRLNNRCLPFALLSLAVIVQPIEVYHYLKQRAQPYFKNAYDYIFPYNVLTLKESPLPPKEMFSSSKGGVLYYASGSYNTLFQNIYNYPLAQYLQNKFILVDHLEVIDPKQVDFSMIENYFYNNANKAFIFKNDSGHAKKDSDDPHPKARALRIDQETENFKVLSFDANHVKLAIHLPYEKFLIYNDNYDPGWRVSINGRQSHIYQANITFKGVWLPKGDSIVEFHYGQTWQYVMNISLIIFGFLFLLGTIGFTKKEELSLKER